MEGSEAVAAMKKLLRITHQQPDYLSLTSRCKEKIEVKGNSRSGYDKRPAAREERSQKNLEPDPAIPGRE